MEMHGGTVAAHSDGPGRGATFTLALPLVLREREAAGSGHQEATANARRILVVDDNADAGESIALLLQLAGHETRVVFDGQQALAAWETFGPDVIVLDIGLPGMDGYDVIQRLRAAGFGGRAIALSGYGQPQDRQKSMIAGFNAHLVKPVDVESLEVELGDSPAGTQSGRSDKHPGKSRMS